MRFDRLIRHFAVVNNSFFDVGVTDVGVRNVIRLEPLTSCKKVTSSYIM